MSLVLNGTEAHRRRHGHSTQHQQMERLKDQHLLHLCTTGKMFPPDKEEDVTPGFKDKTRHTLYVK
jgi:hypothetical protein